MTEQKKEPRHSSRQPVKILEGKVVANSEARAVSNGSTQQDAPDNSLHFKPLGLLTQLKEQASSRLPSAPIRAVLSWDAIRQVPELFQPRVINERHVSELVRVIKLNGRIAPVTIIQVGHEAILIDGHHRMAAYRKAKIWDDIPVIHFGGSVEQAVLETGKANVRPVLSMSNQDKQNYAWKLVQMGRYSKDDIRKAAGISDGQVGIMRRVAKALGDAVFQQHSWRHAQKAAKEKAS